MSVFQLKRDKNPRLPCLLSSSVHYSIQGNQKPDPVFRKHLESGFWFLFAFCLRAGFFWKPEEGIEISPQSLS